MIVLFISLAAIVLSIVIGNRFKANIGVVAGVFSVLIGLIGLQMKASELFELIPDKIIFTVTVITLFYGYLSENGTLAALIDHMVYALKEKCSLIPLAIFLFSVFISCIGIGAPTATAILAPIVMNLAPQIKQHSTLLAASVSYGVCIGGNFILSQGGIIGASIIDQSELYAGHGSNYMLEAFFFSLAFYAAIYLGIHLLTHKRKHAVLTFDKVPAPFTAQQKQSIAILICTLAAILMAALLAQVLPNGPVQLFFSQFDLSFIMLIGILVQSLCHLAEFPQIARKHVPVQTLVFFTGMTMLMGVAQRAGLVELLSTVVRNQVPPFLVAGTMACIAGIMSCFSSTLSVVLPVLFPLVPSIAVGLELSAPLLYSAIFVGSTGAGISPFSTGGFLLLSNCQVREEYHSMWTHLLILCIIDIAAATLLFTVLGIL